MDKETMQTSHERQIKAILTDDAQGFVDALNMGERFVEVDDEDCRYPVDVDSLCLDENNEGEEMSSTLAYVAWGNMGEYPHCLFAHLPAQDGTLCGCLTQVKAANPAFSSSDDLRWRDKLDIADNDLIPKYVSTGDTFTEEQLREFSRLQIEARFPDAK